MINTVTEKSRLWLGAFALLAFGSLVGCISDDSDPAEDETGGTGGTSGSSGTGGSGGSTSGTGGTGGGGPPGTACASVITIPSDKPAIADFDTYMGETLKDWSFALGGETSLMVFTGPFGYGDDGVDSAGQPIPETFAMVDGHDSPYAVSIADSLADEYGGGMGLWLSVCLDVSAFTGISFWVRGNTPTADAALSLVMNETTSNVATTSTDKIGTCEGMDADCIHPKATFPVTDAWTEVRLPWSAFAAGDANGTRIAPDGRNVWQLQFDVSLVWADDGTGMYVPTPAEYDFAVDSMTFY